MPSLLNWQQSCLPGYLLTLDDAMRWAKARKYISHQQKVGGSQFFPCHR